MYLTEPSDAILAEEAAAQERLEAPGAEDQEGQVGQEDQVEARHPQSRQTRSNPSPEQEATSK